MYLEDKRNGEYIHNLPNYGKHDINGNHYGYLLIDSNKKVLYFYLVSDAEIGDSIQYEDVTDKFIILNP